MIDGQAFTVCCSPSIAWVKDAGQTLVVANEAGSVPDRTERGGGARSWSLCGVEATIWDLLSLGYPFERIAAFLAVLLCAPQQQAEDGLWAVLQRWAERDMVRISGGNEHG
jgi:hypothetical protein